MSWEGFTPLPNMGHSMVSFQLHLQENHPHATSQCKISLFQQVPNTQLVRQLNARQPITMRYDQGFHPLLHLRVSNCPFPDFPSSSWYRKTSWKSNLQNHSASLGDQSYQSLLRGSSSPMCSRAVPFAPQNHLWPQKKKRSIDAATTFSAKIQPKHPGEKLAEQIPTRTIFTYLRNDK